MILLKYKSEKGETVELSPKKFKPLSYEDLLPNPTKDDKTYYIDIIADFIVVKGKGYQSTGPGKVSAEINFHNPLTIYALVEGGWLPPPFVIPANLLVDRNVISSMMKITQKNKRPDLQFTDWWLSFLENKTVLINPLLYALEGNKRKPPSYAELCSATKKSATEVTKCLPNAKVAKYDSKYFKSAYAILSDLSARAELETKFLLRVVPQISNRVADPKLLNVQSTILKIAEDLKLNATSLSVLAALSCLYENREGTGFLTARRIITPSERYTEEDAYNALFDLRSIELLLASRMVTQEPYALCTCDRALALFWCGLNPHGVEWKDGTLKFDVSINEYLFPRLPKASREKLVQGLIT